GTAITVHLSTSCAPTDVAASRRTRQRPLGARRLPGPAEAVGPPDRRRPSWPTPRRLRSALLGRRGEMDCVGTATVVGAARPGYLLGEGDRSGGAVRGLELASDRRNGDVLLALLAVQVRGLGVRGGETAAAGRCDCSDLDDVGRARVWVAGEGAHRSAADGAVLECQQTAAIARNAEADRTAVAVNWGQGAIAGVRLAGDRVRSERGRADPEHQQCSRGGQDDRAWMCRGAVHLSCSLSYFVVSFLIASAEASCGDALDLSLGFAHHFCSCLAHHSLLLGYQPSRSPVAAHDAILRCAPRMGVMAPQACGELRRSDGARF